MLPPCSPAEAECRAQLTDEDMFLVMRQLLLEADYQAVRQVGQPARHARLSAHTCGRVGRARGAAGAWDARRR